MKMNAQDIKNLIVSIVQDVVFEYNNKTCCINPYNKHKFELGYGNKVKTYNDIDDLMNDKIFKGKSLYDIAESIDIE